MKLLPAIFLTTVTFLLASISWGLDTSDFLISEDGSVAEQNNPSIAVGLDGRFAVIWVDYAAGDGDVICRLYNSGAIPATGAFIVNDDTTGAWQIYPKLASDWNGNYFAAWQDYRNGNYPFNPDIFYQRLDSTGLLGSNLNITGERPDSSHQSPAIAASGWGKVVASWMDMRNRNWDIYVQTLSPAGILIGSNHKANNDASTTAQLEPDVAISADGWYVVVWYDGRNGNDDIYLQKFDSSGTPIGTNLRVNDDIGTSKQKFPAVTIGGTGVITVVWTDWRNGVYPQNSDIYCQRYSSDLTRLGANFIVNRDGTGTSQRNPRIASDRMGNVCVVWSDSTATDWQATGQMIDNNGRFQSENFAVNLDRPSDQLFPDVALDGYDLYLGWADNRKGNFDIYGRIKHYNNPSLVAIPSDLHFSRDRSDPDTTLMRLIINNAGYGELQYQLSSPQSWLTFSKTSGSTPDTVYVSPNSQNLGLGEYHGWITLINSISGDSTGLVPVTLTITGPIIDPAPDSLTFRALTGQGNPPEQNLLVGNSGTGTFSWHAEKSADWILLDRTDGAAGDLIHVGCDIASLAEGNFDGLIVLTSPEAAGNPDTVRVRAAVESNLPFISLLPAGVFDTLFIGETVSDSIRIINTGIGTLDWRASTTALWMTLQSDSGGDGGVVSYTISAVGLSSQTYIDSLRITDPAAFNTPVYVPIELVVRAADTLVTTPVSVELAQSAQIQLSLRTHNSIQSALMTLAYDPKLMTVDSIRFSGAANLAARTTFAVDSVHATLGIAITADSAGSSLPTGNTPLGDIFIRANDSLPGKAHFIPDSAVVLFHIMTTELGEIRPEAQLGDIDISVSTDAHGQGRGNLPLVFSLGQNSPNPFNGQTAIPFSLARSGQVRLEIYNILGQMVTVLIDGSYAPGRYQASWDGTAGKGHDMASGIYFYRLVTPDKIAVRKMLLMK
jgi:hypothetical protein